jgi:hypothetical protein
MQTPEKARAQVRSALFASAMSPVTKKTIIKNAQESGKVKDYSDSATFHDKKGYVLKDITNTPTKTAPTSPDHAVTNTPGKHKLPYKQKVLVNNNGVLKPVVLFTEDKPAKTIPKQVLVMQKDIVLAENLPRIDKQNLTFGPINIGSIPSAPMRRRKDNVSQNELMNGLSASKYIAIDILEDLLENGLAVKVGLAKKKLKEYSDEELKLLCVAADIRIDGQWLHSVAYSLGNGTPEGNTQVLENLTACESAVNDRMKTAEEIARKIRATEQLKQLQFSAKVTLRKRKIPDSVIPGDFRQEGEEYIQTFLYEKSSVTFFHDRKNKNKRSKAHKPYFEPLVTAYLKKTQKF